MAFIDTLLGSGVFVLFLAVIVGMAFGRIDFGRGIKFGVAGPLFAGLYSVTSALRSRMRTRGSRSRCSSPQSG